VASETSVTARFTKQSLATKLEYRKESCRQHSNSLHFLCTMHLCTIEHKSNNRPEVVLCCVVLCCAVLCRAVR